MKWIWLITLPALLAGCWIQEQRMNVPITDGSANTVPLDTVCMGRVQVDLPRSGGHSWSQSLGQLKISRETGVNGIDIQTPEQFWTHVQARKRELESRPHDTEGTLLSKYDVLGDRAARISFRGSAASTYTHKYEYFLFAGDHAYKAQAEVSSEPEYRAETAAELAEFDASIQKITPRSNLNLSPGPGFCIDGGIVNGAEGEVTAAAGISARIPKVPNAYLWVSDAQRNDATPIVEHPDQTADSELEREREVNEFYARHGSIQDRVNPAFPTRFVVLRQADRSLAGIPGREAIWCTHVRGGAAICTFRWAATGSQRGSTGHPNVNFGMDVGDIYKPTDAPADEAMLIALWDAMLASLKIRPDAYAR